CVSSRPVVPLATEGYRDHTYIEAQDGHHRAHALSSQVTRPSCAAPMCPRCPGRYTSHDAVFGLAPDPGAERLGSGAECRENSGEELNSHLNYERDAFRP